MPLVGRPAPPFAGPGALHGDTVQLDLADHAGRWLVLFFYPLDFTFVCPTEVVAFSDRIADFQALGADVVGVSVDSVHTHLAWTRTPRSEGGVGDIAFPLLADLSKEVARAYEVLDGDVALRGLFVIDPDGVVQHATINNLSVGRNVDEVLRTVQAFQHCREHGDTCPANWAGGAGMPETLEGVARVIG